MTFAHENLFIFEKYFGFYYTSRLSNPDGEICLQTYPPIIEKVSITNYLNQNAKSRPFDHIKFVGGRKKVVILKTSATFFPPKNSWVRA